LDDENEDPDEIFRLLFIHPGQVPEWELNLDYSFFLLDIWEDVFELIFLEPGPQFIADYKELAAEMVPLLPDPHPGRWSLSEARAETSPRL